MDHHYFQNKKPNNERFLDSWEIITQHCDTNIVPFQSTKQNKPSPPTRGSPTHVQITTDGEYIIYIDDLPFKATQNTLGELTVGEALELIPDNIDPSPPTRWGKGYKGPRRESFPLPDEYALDANNTPLDQITVKTLTASFSALQNPKPHPCIAAWEKRLHLTIRQWKIIASRYNNSLLTPRDYHLHFKHITHRRIGTNNRFADQPSACRFCHKYVESSVHLGRCPSLKKIFGTINKALGFAPRTNRNAQEQATDTLFCFPHDDTPHSVAHLYLIAWRFILTDFYQIKYNTELPPFDEARAHSLYSRTLERYTTLVMAKAYKVRVIIHTRERSGATHPQRLINRTNHTISPLFRLDAEGTLSMSKQMAKRLDIAKIGHVGKNIRILSTDEQ